MNIVSTMAKNERIYIRLSSELKEDFAMVAEYRGLTTSSLLHSLIVKTVREEKSDNPEAFSAKHLKGKLIDIGEKQSQNKKVA